MNATRQTSTLRGTLLTALALAGCGAGTSSPTATDAAAADVVSAADAATTDAPSTPDVATVADAPPASDRPAIDPDAGSAEPVTATAGSWTWVPVEGARCGNGSQAGFGINPSPTPGARDAVIFLMGGGGCWDGLTCVGVPVAAHINEDYTEGVFRSDLRGVSGMYAFSRTNAQNPFRDAHYVFVPYCTGDIHGGDAETEYTWGSRRTTIHHVGARNMALFLRRLRGTWPDARRITLTGISAGGFGAGLNWWRVADAFPSTRVDLIDDSGPPFMPPVSRWNAMRDAWNPQFPAACTACRDNLEALLDFYATRFPPPARMALLSYTRDTTISTYFGITQDEFQAQLLRLAQERIATRPNFRHFIVNGSSHVLSGGAARITGGGVTLQTWIERMVTDAPGWDNVAP